MEAQREAAQPAPSTVPLPVAPEPPLPRTPVPAPCRTRYSERLETGRVQAELARVQAELEQCRAELAAKTQELGRVEVSLAVPGPTRALTGSADRKLEEAQKNLRQLRLDLRRLVGDLQSGERACCRNTDGERLRQALTSADETLIKQDHILSELQGGMRLIRVALGKKADSLAQLQAASSRPPLVPPPSSYMATPTSCNKRGCGNAENQPPEKRTFLAALFPPMCTPTRQYGGRGGAMMRANQTATPSARILRTRQQSPPPGPAPSTPRFLRGKY
ncbi:hypothetical protein CRUP_028672 [Coryphaenoides rupestris]|nr:hypothetical protein CRUP_028672 [Coryphaenoides rupestris]